MKKRKGIKSNLTIEQHADCVIAMVGMDDLKKMGASSIVSTHLQGLKHKKLSEDQKMAIALDVLVKIDRYYRR